MTSQETPFALTIVKLFIVPIVIAITIWAGGFAAISTAILVIPIWTVLYTIASSEAMLKALDHLMLYRIRTREIEAQLTANLAQIHMQQAVSMARTQVEIGRQEIASRALIASHSSALDGGTLWNVTEQQLVDAVLKAYDLARPDGVIPNNVECPFGARALGGAYDEIVYRLAHPGEKFGIAGSPPVATYDERRRRWVLNLKDYPTPGQALQALTGRMFYAR
jgi:hypothetical protein